MVAYVPGCRAGACPELTTQAQQNKAVNNNLTIFRLYFLKKRDARDTGCAGRQTRSGILTGHAAQCVNRDPDLSHGFGESRHAEWRRSGV